MSRWSGTLGGGSKDVSTWMRPTSLRDFVKVMDSAVRLIRGDSWNIRSGDGEAGHGQGENTARELHLDEFKRSAEVTRRKLFVVWLCWALLGAAGIW